MVYFDITEKDLGLFPKETSHTLVYPLRKGHPEIVRVTGECNCTKGYYSKELDAIVVTYKAGNIPRQVLGNQPIVKYVNVYFSNGSHNVLKITGTKTQS